MRRWIIYLGLTVLLLLVAPVKKSEIGELVPVELVAVYRTGGKLCIETDTGNRGIGHSLQSALEDMKATSSGVIFLETADYLIITENVKSLLPELGGILRPGTEVCLGDYADDQTAKFLKTHQPGVTLNDLRAGEVILPRLIWTGACYRLESHKA